MTAKPRWMLAVGHWARSPRTASRINPRLAAGRRATDSTDDLFRWIDDAQAANRDFYGNMLAAVAILVALLALAVTMGLLPR
jgi:hypothetical protein